MKHAEFLNLDTKQVQWLDASLEHPNLVRVPDGAMRFSDGGFFKSEKVWFNRVSGSWCFRDGGWSGFDKNVIWQRPIPLRQKVDEAKQKLGMNERQLSKAICREESYITKLFQNKRNPCAKTIETLIADLDQLIRTPVFKNCKFINSEYIELNTLKISYEQEIKLKIALLNQANDNALMWQKKYKDQKNVSLFLISIISASIVFLVLYCLWGAL